MGSLIRDRKVDRNIFYQLRLRRLQLSVQQILAVGDSDAEIDIIAKITDKIYESTRHTVPQRHNSTVDEIIDALREEIDVLCHKLTNADQNNRQSRWSQRRLRGMYRSCSWRRLAPNIFWYHQNTAAELKNIDNHANLNDPTDFW